MSDMFGNDLKDFIRNQFFYALEHAKNPSINIYFVFTGMCCGETFRFIEKISYFAGDFYYKNVCFSGRVGLNNTIINFIINNFHYDYFSFINCNYKHGKTECHGHGEFWGTDTFTFNFKRLDFENE